jgi:hypothetical protein
MEGQQNETESRILKYTERNCVSITLTITNYVWTAPGLIQAFLWSKAVVKCSELCCVLTSVAQSYTLGY